MNKKYYKISFLLILSVLLMPSCTIFYSDLEEEKNETNPKLTNYKNGKFVNANPQKGVTESFFKVGYMWLFENNMNRKPNF